MTVSRSHIDYDNDSDFKELSIKAQNILRSLKRLQVDLLLARADNNDKE